MRLHPALLKNLRAWERNSENNTCTFADFGIEYKREVFKLTDKTMTFSIGNEQEQEIRRILLEVYDALKEKGYNPINQIVGYILSEDPTYITTHNNARNLIRRVDRDTLLQMLVKYYLTN